ncbi:hypothetical protein [Benzoatithermus flavus]|uniref:Uncharacterized protein n=1 Tax=Benzoatithermus flavus TaxID=3108223 RepID=A0ABU8XNR7_9PROT
MQAGLAHGEVLAALLAVGIVSAAVATAGLAAAAELPASDTALAGMNADAAGGPCGLAASVALGACRSGAESDFLLAQGICANVADRAAHDGCLGAARDERRQAKSLCTAQFAARQRLCAALGPAAYDPRIDPRDFITAIVNPFFPLRPGTIFVYRQPHGTDTVTVTRRTRRIAGVECVVVHDRSVVDGAVDEDTLDYYAQDRAGNVWYFGEDSQTLEEGRVVGVEGSWRAGVDGARPGIIMPANPAVGRTDRQEFALGTAEDAAAIEGLDARVSVPFGVFRNALRTRAFSPLEPDALETKFYARGIGLVLTIDQVTHEREELIRIEHR